MPKPDPTSAAVREAEKAKVPVPPPPGDALTVSAAAARTGETVVDVIRTGGDTWRIVHGAEQVGTVDGYDKASVVALELAERLEEAADLRRQADAIEVEAKAAVMGAGGP